MNLSAGREMKDDQVKEVEAADPLWADLAACRGVDTNLFFSDSKADQVYAVDTYCEKCPVKRECLDDATKDDLQASVRGGYLIGEVKDRGKSRIALKPRKKMCDRGHSLENKESVSKVNGECLKCRQLRLEAQRRGDYSSKYGNLCNKGLHILGPGKITPRGLCKECRLDTQNVYRRAKRKGAPAVDLTNESTAA